MKVLVFMTQFHNLGGAERLGVELAEGLNQRGIRADIVGMYREDEPGVAQAKNELLSRGIPSVRFLSLPVHPPALQLFTAAQAMRQMIREGKYDIVETSQTSPTVIALWATLFGGARHVAGLHHVFRRELHDSLHKKFWRWSVRLNRRTRYYAISDYAREAWIRYANVDFRRVRRVYNAIADDCFRVEPDCEGVRAELGIPPGRRIALFVGRLAAYKGIDTVLEALEPILDEQDLCLLYVGLPDLSVTGTEQMLADVRQRVEQGEMSDRVRFLGSRKDIPRLMASSDILIHPPRTEGFGLVLAEAMAAGLPVVATNVEGIPEVLAGTDSILVPPDDSESLRNAVLNTLNRSAMEMAQAIAKGHQRAEDFRMTARIDAMLELFRDTIDNRF